MKISRIILNNFRQYYANNIVNLNTENEKNIILIGGKNGYGKTNFLIAIVWCLYGNKITLIDDSFKREVQKDQNYSKFIRQSLNWKAKEESNPIFSVEIQVEEISCPEINLPENKIIIKRTFDADKSDETLHIMNVSNEILFDADDDNFTFINEYLIPLEAAKFVFFDAEKIASWAELSTKDEGSVLNDALGKILGLDLYENLKDDLIVFSNNLKREHTTSKNQKEEINNTENQIQKYKSAIEDIDIHIASNENKIQQLDDKIKEYHDYLNKNSQMNNRSIDREDLEYQLEKLNARKRELETQFNELSEIMPLAILAGKIEEVIEHIEIQDKIQYNTESNENNKKKLDQFIEKLFNQPPDPEDGSMTFKNKLFYSEKAQSILDEIFKINTSAHVLDFELDLNNTDKNLIHEFSNLLTQTPKDSFENTISEFNSVQIEITDLDKQIKIIDSDCEDETISEYVSKKEKAEREKVEVIKENGSLENDKEKIQKDTTRLSHKLKTLYEHLKFNKLTERKINIVYLYISSIQAFIDKQKHKKKESMAATLLTELKKLMHKMQTNNSNFIEDIRIDILPEGKGLKVSLLDIDGNEISKESFSTGEKQIYISCLIKAILKESIENFPIFIDTPLGRLDHEHIENILTNYYPDLSNQVVLLSTNNEITPRRFDAISNKVSQSYLIMNENKMSKFKEGYFQKL